MLLSTDPVFNVTIRLDDGSIVPTNKDVYLDQLLTCTADGSPPPHLYTWERFDKIRWVALNQNESELKWTDVGYQMYRCTAYNFVQRQTYNATSPNTTANFLNSTGKLLLKQFKLISNIVKR